MVVGAGVVLAIGLLKYKAVTVVLVDPRQPRVTASEAVLSGLWARTPPRWRARSN